MSSNIKINRICNFCNKEFIAKTTVTKYCSLQCASKAYKKKTREKKIEKSNIETVSIIQQPVEAIKSKDFLNVKELSLLLNCSIRTIYRLIENGTINSLNLNQRLTRIKRKDIDSLFISTISHKKVPQLEAEPIIKIFDVSDYYTISEVLIKFNIAEWICKQKFQYKLSYIFV